MPDTEKAQHPFDDIIDCGEDGCGECHICEYLDFLEYAHAVAPPGSRITRDPVLEAYINEHYGGTGY